LDVAVRVVTKQVFCKFLCFLVAPTFSNWLCSAASSYISGAERRVLLLVVGSGNEMSVMLDQSLIRSFHLCKAYLRHPKPFETSFPVLQQPLELVVVVAAFAAGVGEGRMHDSM